MTCFKCVPLPKLHARVRFPSPTPTLSRFLKPNVEISFEGMALIAVFGAKFAHEGDKMDDQKAIEAIVARQFGSLNWTPDKPCEWNDFIADFLAGALLYPSARPAKSQTPDDFVLRMKGLAESRLHSFKEDVLGHQIFVFGNVAVAVAGCQITENDKEVSRGVEMMLLIKQEGRWRIVAQAWDMENDSKKLPSELIGL